MEVVDADALVAEGGGGGEGAPSSSSLAAVAHTCSTSNTSSSSSGSDDIEAPNFGTFLVMGVGVPNRESTLILPLCPHHFSRALLSSFSVPAPCLSTNPSPRSSPLGDFFPGLQARVPFFCPYPSTRSPTLTHFFLLPPCTPQSSESHPP